VTCLLMGSQPPNYSEVYSCSWSISADLIQALVSYVSLPGEVILSFDGLIHPAFMGDRLTLSRFLDPESYGHF
jgi:hypothetical protein